MSASKKIEKGSTQDAYFNAVFYRLDFWIQEIIQNKPTNENGDSFSSLYVSENEVTKLLDTNILLKKELPASTLLENLSPLPYHKPFDKLQKVFGLNELDLTILHIIISPYIEAKYTRIFGFLNDNTNKQSATLSLIFLILSKQFSDNIVILNRLTEQSPLRKYQLVELESSNVFKINPQESIKISPRILEFLISDKTTRIIQDKSSTEHPLLECSSDSLKSIKRTLDNQRVNDNQNCIVCFSGTTSSGKSDLAKYLASQINREIFEYNLNDYLEKPANEIHNLICDNLNLAVLNSAILLLRNLDEFINKPKLWSIISNIISNAPKKNIIFLTAGYELINNQNIRSCFSSGKIWQIKVDLPDYNQRKFIWHTVLPKEYHNKAEFLASRYAYSKKDIIRVMEVAKDQSISAKISWDDIVTGCRSQRVSKLGKLATRINLINGWDDIILPNNCRQQLREIQNYLRYLEKIRSEWGFDKRVRQNGLTVLFSGDTGVGKTMAAGIICKELNIELYRIDLSQVVNKYIGETEKNLSKLFDEAEVSGAALFFDEADSLFGKRTEIRDSHDRYANTEINFLLQKMEEYCGLTILATNLRQNIEHAFLRRIHYLVDFPFPSSVERQKMWIKMFPDKTPLSDDINFDWLAEKVELAGGNLHNITLESAILAASENRPVSMSDILQAVNREYEKLQKTFFDNTSNNIDHPINYVTNNLPEFITSRLQSNQTTF